MSCESVASSTPKSTLHAKTLLQRYKNFMKRNHSMQKKLQKETKILLFMGKMASKNQFHINKVYKGSVRSVLAHSTQIHPKLHPSCSHTTALLKSKAGRRYEYGITMDTLCLWLVSLHNLSKEQSHIKWQTEQILFFPHVFGMKQIALIDA